MNDQNAVRLLGTLYREETVEFEVGAREIVNWLKEKPERIAYAMGRLGQPDKEEDRPMASDLARLYACMDGIERDEFFARIKAIDPERTRALVANEWAADKPVIA